MLMSEAVESPIPALEPASEPNSQLDATILEAAEELLDQQEGEGGSGDSDDNEDDTPTDDPNLSPFALTDAHEFPTADQRAIAKHVEEVVARATVSLPAALADAPSVPPPLPGTALSPYRHCPCLAVLPGRVCTFCFGTRWTRLCPKCEGEGRIDLSVRKGAERSQPCGNCGGKGTLPANLKEVNEATRLAEEFAAGPAGQSVPSPTPEPVEFRRAVRLPGIGVTATKRGGTLASRKKEKARLAQRTADRKAKKTAAGK
jgi:hypothetical protein